MRTASRRKKFEELYKKVKDEDVDWMKVIAHADETGSIRSKKMYLYLTQKGRCMYTGKHIELSDLFNNNLYAYSIAELYFEPYFCCNLFACSKRYVHFTLYCFNFVLAE